jgi:beta-xylosidase
VEEGWQLALRSKSIYGPYVEKIVLAQGKSRINGPHQGAWVDTQTGEDWFIHFQDQGAYGRIVHLQPVKWIDDWPVMGVDADGDGTGEPVLTHKKPTTGRGGPIMTPPDSDEFNSNGPGLQWQWNANPGTHWAFPAGSLGFLRLFNLQLPEGFRNFWDVPNLLLQKFPAPEFTATTKVRFTPRADDEETGLIVMGLDYSYLSVKKTPGGLSISQTVVTDAESGAKGKETPAIALRGDTFFLRVKVSQNAVCVFSYSSDGKQFSTVGEPFTARKGKWIGAKVGIFAVGTAKIRETGYADFDWFRVE